ncbi:unnamed protein product [Rhizophagus irregularis]|uniref:Uncharacterized protein n=1 Tax=Rhizophagus irregularis TaxID=588596 RepID=A0A2N1MIQ0_9GLOM|nr:hypothetical protein RhiirC2_791709 [Rhizophagus irregularis]CAB5370262.1 unnamed protein product [Rhizophagus irregularis]
MATKPYNANSSEPLMLTDDDQKEINASLCLLWTKFDGRLKNVVIQDQRAFINYGKHQEKIVIDLVKSNCTIVNRNILNEENREFDLKNNNTIKEYNEAIKSLKEKLNASEIRANKAIEDLQTYEIHKEALKKKIDSEQTNNASQSLEDVSQTSLFKTIVVNNFNTNNEGLDIILTNDVKLMKCKLDDDIDLIWEELNTRLHKMFGYAEEIKRGATLEDLNWAHETLPAYINWDRMNNLRPMVKFWLQKVNKQLKKLSKPSSAFTNHPINKNTISEEIEDDKSGEELNFKKKEKALKNKDKKIEKFIQYGQELREKAIKAIQDDSQLATNNNDSLVNYNRNLVKSFEVFSNEPIKIIDITSAEKRVSQWISQKESSDKIESALKVYKFYHRINLIYIYEEFNQFVTNKYADDVEKQEVLERQLERDMFCALQQIVPRTERRRKESSKRLRDLIDAGITFDQIVDIGMTITDFETDNIYYLKFLSALDLQTIKNSCESDDDVSVERPNPKIMLNKLTKSINKISSLKIQEIDEQGDRDENDVDNMEVDIVNC